MAPAGAMVESPEDGTSNQNVAPRATFIHVLQGIFGVIILGLVGFATSYYFYYAYYDALGLNLATASVTLIVVFMFLCSRSTIKTWLNYVLALLWVVSFSLLAVRTQNTRVWEDGGIVSVMAAGAAFGALELYVSLPPISPSNTAYCFAEWR